MKTIIRLFAAVLTAVPVLVSCYSEPLPEIIPEVIPEDEDNGSEQDATTRIITLSFDTKATRTYLDGKTPKFSDGDEIAVALADDEITDSDNGIQICTVSVDENGIATTTTTFTEGKLMAVYPAKYARVVNGQLTYFVPSEQTGEFEDANICTAEISDGSNPCAVFYNQTAVFKIELPDLPNKSAEIQRLVVTSLGRIDNTTGQRGGKRARISNGNEVDEADYSIMLDYMYEEDDPVYYPNPLFVSVLCDTDGTNGPVYLADLNFDINYYLNYDEDGKEFDDIYAMGGFSPVFLKKTFGEGFADEVIQKGAIYTGVEDHLHEYISNPHDSGHGRYTYIWAKKDLNTSGGNTTDFFMWGELSGHSYVEAENEVPAYWTNLTGGFIEGNIPKVVENYKSGDVLQLKDDAAYQNWGGAWRMPKFEEMQTWSGGASTNAFPMTLSMYSYVQGNNGPTQGAKYYYWTSEKGKAFYYSYNTESFVAVPNNPEDQSCFYGMLIRPMSGIIEEIIEEYESD